MKPFPVNYFAANPIEGVTLAKGDPDLLNDWKPSITFATEKAKEILGTVYKSPEESARESVDSAMKRGWSF
jgi:hypothetical protein